MTEQAVIVVSRQLPQAFMDGLGTLGEVRVAKGAEHDVFRGAAVYVAPGTDPVPAALIERLPESVKLIANIAVGTDNIDLDAAASRGIMVSNTPVVTEDTADLAMALLLASCRRLSHAEAVLRAGQWERGINIPGIRVHGKTLGIVGLGAIGQAVARRAAGFGMTICYYGRQRKPAAEQALGAVFKPTLEELLQSADVVSLHCPLTPATRHLINRETLPLFKAGAILVNTGRGALVDEAALIEALAAGRLGGAGLDVFEFEPEVSPELLSFDNVTLSPHIGSATAECRMDMALRTLANIRTFLDEGLPGDQVV